MTRPLSPCPAYDGQVGNERSPAEYLATLLACTREWVRVLKPEGSMFVNLGDKYSQPGKGERNMQGIGGGIIHKVGARQANRSARDFSYGGVPGKSLIGLPWRYALRCVDDLGLILRRDIIWHKVNGLPESATDRCRSSHEYLFHLVKQSRYFSAVDEIRESYGPNTHAGRSDGRPSPATRAVQQARPMGAGFTQLNGDLSARNPLGKLPGSVWDIPSQPLIVPDWLDIDHFAAFPMELPRRIILGWSPSGICLECGEGRRPVSVSTITGDRGGRQFNPASGNIGVLGKERSYAIIGYACACLESDAPTRPALVLDPFGGTGTTSLVADVLGRIGITVDRSADYCRLARWRTYDPAERARALCVPKPPPVPKNQGSLFDDLEAS
jgi:DNA modification methylase